MQPREAGSGVEVLGEALAADTEFRTGSAGTARGLLRVPSALAPLEAVLHADLDAMGRQLQARRHSCHKQ